MGADRYGRKLRKSTSNPLNSLNGSLAGSLRKSGSGGMQTLDFYTEVSPEVVRKSVPHTPYALPCPPSGGTECMGGDESAPKKTRTRKPLLPEPEATLEARRTVIAGATDWVVAAERLAAAGYLDGVIQRAEVEKAERAEREARRNAAQRIRA